MCRTCLLLATVLSVISAPAWAQLNVRDFGAVGDGATDDTAAFQAALDRCALSGGVVSVPPGRYMIATHLTIPRSVTLEGFWQAPPTVDRYHDPDSPKGTAAAGRMPFLFGHPGSIRYPRSSSG